MAVTKSFSKDRQKCKVTFSLPIEAAPEAKEIKVLGDFNKWNWDEGLQLKAGKKDYKAQMELPAGTRYEFRYQIDQFVWENDWKADDYVPTPFPGVMNSVLVLGNGTKKAPARKTSAKTATAKVATTNKPKAVVKKTKNFTVIEGVGPKINTLLEAAGYKTFNDLAKANPAQIKEVLKNAGSRFSMHDPTSWPKQATLAAADKWEELKKLQAKLNAGKKVK